MEAKAKIQKSITEKFYRAQANHKGHVHLNKEEAFLILDSISDGSHLLDKITSDVEKRLPEKPVLQTRVRTSYDM